MVILKNDAIKQKIVRLAYEIAEQNYDAREIVLLGINNNGWRFAKLLQASLEEVLPGKSSLSRLRLNPAKPNVDPIVIDNEINHLKGKSLIVVDDVANTGRTLFYAVKPLLEIIPAKVQMAVLVDRMHKSFPVHVDFVGLSLATTVQDHIEVHLGKSASVALA